MQKTMVDRPKCVQVYNEYMRDIDKLDFLISMYRTKAKTKNGIYTATCKSPTSQHFFAKLPVIAVLNYI